MQKKEGHNLNIIKSVWQMIFTQFFNNMLMAYASFIYTYNRTLYSFLHVTFHCIKWTLPPQTGTLIKHLLLLNLTTVTCLYIIIMKIKTLFLGGSGHRALILGTTRISVTQQEQDAKQILGTSYQLKVSVIHVCRKRKGQSIGIKFAKTPQWKSNIIWGSGWAVGGLRPKGSLTILKGSLMTRKLIKPGTYCTCI